MITLTLSDRDRSAGAIVCVCVRQEKVTVSEPEALGPAPLFKGSSHPLLPLQLRRSGQNSTGQNDCIGPIRRIRAVVLLLKRTYIPIDSSCGPPRLCLTGTLFSNIAA